MIPMCEDCELPQWIKVTDRLPEPDTECLAYASDYSGHYEIINAIYEDRYNIPVRNPDYKFYEYCHCSGYERDDMTIKHVSHWMPLPNPPCD